MVETLPRGSQPFCRLFMPSSKCTRNRAECQVTPEGSVALCKLAAELEGWSGFQAAFGNRISRNVISLRTPVGLLAKRPFRMARNVSSPHKVFFAEVSERNPRFGLSGFFMEP